MVKNEGKKLLVKAKTQAKKQEIKRLKRQDKRQALKLKPVSTKTA
jgi:hypothetical protein